MKAFVTLCLVVLAGFLPGVTVLYNNNGTATTGDFDVAPDVTTAHGDSRRNRYIQPDRYSDETLQRNHHLRMREWCAG